MKGSGELRTLDAEVSSGRMRYQARPQPRGREKWLRAHATNAEKTLWSALRMLSFKFRRQHRIGSFIVDFYCPEVRLAVEVDGGVHSHETAAMRDCERDKTLRRLGIHVLRFRNDEVFCGIAAVVRCIEDVCLFL